MEARYTQDNIIELIFDTPEDHIILRRALGCQLGEGSQLKFNLKASNNNETLFVVDRPFNNSEAGLNASDMRIIMEYIVKGASLAAVKHLKEVTGWGLREAKDYIDSIRPQQYNKE